MFSDHKRIKLELNNRNKSAKLSKYLEIDSWIREEVTKRVRKCLDLKENRNTIKSKFVECN